MQNTFFFQSIDVGGTYLLESFKIFVKEIINVMIILQADYVLKCDLFFSGFKFLCEIELVSSE